MFLYKSINTNKIYNLVEGKKKEREKERKRKRKRKKERDK